MTDTPVHHMLVRRYRMSGSRKGTSPLTLTIYIHGGGFVVYDLDSHDSICAELGAATGYLVTAVVYRLAPEHPDSAAFSDCLAVVLSEVSRVIRLYQYSGSGKAGISSICFV